MEEESKHRNLYSSFTTAILVDFIYPSKNIHGKTTPHKHLIPITLTMHIQIYIISTVQLSHTFLRINPTVLVQFLY